MRRTPSSSEFLHGHPNITWEILPFIDPLPFTHQQAARPSVLHLALDKSLRAVCRDFIFRFLMNRVFEDLNSQCQFCVALSRVVTKYRVTSRCVTPAKSRECRSSKQSKLTVVSRVIGKCKYAFLKPELLPSWKSYEWDGQRYELGLHVSGTFVATRATIPLEWAEKTQYAWMTRYTLRAAYR